MTIVLDQIQSPQDIKNLSQEELEDLAAQIRERLVSVVNIGGGHLASNLGVVELTLALHSVLDSAKDKIVWDVSHQSYVHKMLTGRMHEMMKIRQYGGISGFTKMIESPHDAFGAGHASTAMSAALGIAHARDIQHEDYAVVAVVGDGSLSGGMVYEALNNAEKLKSNFICILNDNDMAISRPIGSMAKYMTQLRTSTGYNRVKAKFEHVFSKIPKIGVPLGRKIEKTVERIRDIVIDFKFGVLFEEFGFRYLGPLDGHNIPLLMGALRYAKNYQGPIIIHVLTKKGKGYALAEDDPVTYHGLSPKMARSTEMPTFTQVFGKELVTLGEQFSNLAVVTPAMMKGSGLESFAKQFPGRFFDVGIAEEHAVTFCAGLASAGLKPVLAIYSTFLQRGYDQVIHDVCLQNLPVIFAIDRAGLVGEDGPTHHGVFDIAFLIHIPNIIILAPKDGSELRQMMHWAMYQSHPIAMRYPKDPISEQDTAITAFEPVALQTDSPKAEVLFTKQSSSPNAPHIVLIATGSLSWTATEAAKLLAERMMQITIQVIHLQSIKPLDIGFIQACIEPADRIIVLEEGCAIGGLYAYILEQLHTQKPLSCFSHLALPDHFIEHGANEILRHQYQLSKEKIVSYIQTLI